MKKVPNFKTDAEAESFLEQDLSDLDFSQFKPVNFEFAEQEENLSLRLSSSLLTAIKAKAANKGLSSAQYVRKLLELDVSNSEAVSH